MKIKSSAKELTDDLENDLALVMLVEKRHAAKIGSRQARDLIEKVKDALSEDGLDEGADRSAQDLISDFPVH
jgi:hypothetical protein